MMKKLLFSLFAVLCSAGAYAHEAGDYVYTSAQRFQLTSANLLTNGDFSDASYGGWTNVEGGSIDAEAWALEDGMGPDGGRAVTSQGADKNGSLVQALPVEVGNTYVLSFWVKGETLANTTTMTAYVNMNGGLLKDETVPGVYAPITLISSINYGTEWREVAGVVTISDTLTANHEGIPTLIVNLTAVPTAVQVANFSVNTAKEVYDIRPVQSKIAFAKQLLDDANFNTAEAQDARDQLEYVIATLEGNIANNELDDQSIAAEYVLAFDEYFESYLGATSSNMSSFIPGLDIASQDYYGRAGIGNRAATYKLDLSGNWGHLNTEPDVLRSAIQTGYAHSATYAAYHEDFPAGKYFFTAEIRNANTGRTSWPTEPVFNLETEGCKMFIGTDSIELPVISGEEFQRFYMVADVAEDGKFRAGVYWPGVSSGGAFFIRSTSVRAFNPNMVAAVEHVQAFKKFKAQWEAAVNGRKNLVDKLADGNYPWDKQAGRDALEKYDPYFNAQAAKGWITEDGTDAGVANTDELNDWALYQGVEEYTTNEETGETTRLEYQVVRGYQNATTIIVNGNKPFTDLAEAIDAAKKTRNQGTNLTGDREAYKAAILKAINTITEIRNNTSDEKKEEDSAKLATALEELNAATEAFLNSVTLPDLVNIDFSNPIVEDASEEPVSPYYIDGNPGKIHLPATTELDNTQNSAQTFMLGWNGEYNDVLRVGNGEAKVILPEELTDGDAADFEFDLFVGNLSGRFVYVDLRNAAGVRVAGFKINRYNGTVEYNEFNDVLTNGGTGMNILQYVTAVGSSSASNAAILADNNRSHFKLTVDYPANKIQGTVVNPQRGTNEGASFEIPMPSDGDNKVAQFVVGSNYNNSDRRCWFDNLRIVKYGVSEDVQEDITESPWSNVYDGIQTVATETKVADNAVYNLMGVRVNKAQKGLYIMNGKKYVVK